MPLDAAHIALLAVAALASSALVVLLLLRARSARTAATLRRELDALAIGVSRVGTYVERRAVAADGASATTATRLPASLERLGEGAAQEEALHALIAPTSRATLDERDAALRAGEVSDVVINLVDKDGWSAICRELVVPLGDAVAPGGAVRVLVDVTDAATSTGRLEKALAEAYEARIVAERERAAARRLAAADVVTGAANRASLLAAASAAVLGDQSGRVALLMIEIDRPDAPASPLGDVGRDRLLAESARRLHARVEDGETLGRWDRNQLALLIPSAPSEQELRARGRALRAALADEPFSVGDRTVSPTPAVAVAITDPGADVEQLVAEALRTLREARQATDGVALAADTRTAALDVSGLHRTAASIAQVVEIREGVPSGHGQRVASLADGIARELGLPEVAVARCRLVGWLHDVGMVAVPDAIVRKPAPLGVAELTTMRTHAPVGEQLVRRMPLLAEAGPGVRHHHERWDGLGYPDGIAGNAIPIEARVVAAADTWVAMREPRPFRAPLPRDRALDELRAASGAHIDPDVVEALLRIVEREDAAALPF